MTSNQFELRPISLDTATWQSFLDFSEAILRAIQAPSWHGRGFDAVFEPLAQAGIGPIDPPFAIIIANAARLPNEVHALLVDMNAAIADHADDLDQGPTHTRITITA